MSRSKKKPYVAICGSAAGMNHWKKESNRRVRRCDLEDNISKIWKKINDNWDSPKDGTNLFWDNPKATRK